MSYSYTSLCNDLPVTPNAPIGIFDSGVGGLTVLQQLNRQLANESIIYFGDTARLPYGTRTHAEILQFMREILTWMLQQHVKMVDRVESKTMICTFVP